MNLFRVLSIVFLLTIILSSTVCAEDYELYIAQGISKINEGKYKDALELLKKALNLSPQNPEATYYAGIAYSRLGRYSEAEDLLLKTLKYDVNAADAYFELGRLYYLTSRCDKAEKFFSRFVDLSVREELKRYASDLIKSCGERVEERPYRIALTTGVQYDSNVILDPSNPLVRAARKSDIRAEVYINSGATLLKNKFVKLEVDYNFYQSLHKHVSDFNMHYHQITPRFEIALSDTVIPSAGYSLEYALVGGDLYTRVHTYYGKITVKESEKLSTEAIYEYRDHKYWDNDLFQTNSERSGHQNTIGLKQNFYLKRLSGNIYYFSDFDRTKKKYWDFNGYRAGAELGFGLSPFYISIGGEYGEGRYREDFPGQNEKRLDKTQLYSAEISYMITKTIGVHITNSYTINDSNLRDFDYKRNMTGIYLSLEAL